MTMGEMIQEIYNGMREGISGPNFLYKRIKLGDDPLMFKCTTGFFWVGFKDSAWDSSALVVILNGEQIKIVGTPTGLLNGSGVIYSYIDGVASFTVGNNSYVFDIFAGWK